MFTMRHVTAMAAAPKVAAWSCTYLEKEGIYNFAHLSRPSLCMYKVVQ